MPEFISENVSTIVISIVVFAVIILDMIYLVRQKKKGKNSCSGCCESCGRCRK